MIDDDTPSNKWIIILLIGGAILGLAVGWLTAPYGWMPS